MFIFRARPTTKHSILLYRTGDSVYSWSPELKNAIQIKSMNDLPLTRERLNEACATRGPDQWENGEYIFECVCVGPRQQLIDFQPT